MGEPETIFSGLPPKTHVGDIVKKDEYGKILKAQDQSNANYDIMYVLSAKVLDSKFSNCINTTEYTLFGPKFGFIKCNYRYKSANFFGISQKDRVMVQKNRGTDRKGRKFGDLETDYVIIRNLTRERELRDFLLDEIQIQKQERE